MIKAEEIKIKYFQHFNDLAMSGNQRLKVPLKSIRASMIGKCARMIYYSMVEPREGTGWHNAEKEMVFKDGKEHEKIIIRELSEIGFDIINQQRPVSNHPELLKRNITGHIEFQFQEPDGSLTPCEIKSMSTYGESSINEPADLDNYWYYKGYLDQVQMYLVGLDSSQMPYVIKNKNTSIPNIFDVYRDEDRIKYNFEKADMINICVRQKEPPPRQKWCEECAGCNFLQHCLPDIKGDGKMISIEEPEASIIEIIERKESLAAAHKEHEKCSKLLKQYWNSRLPEGEDFKIIIMGNRKFELKRQYRKGYEVKPFDFVSCKEEK